MRLYHLISFACIVACMRPFVQNSVVQIDDYKTGIAESMAINTLQLDAISSSIQNLTEVKSTLNSEQSATVPRSCRDKSIVTSGVYSINPQRGTRDPFMVHCDQEYEGGGWTVMQHRFDGSVNFLRPWQEYKDGFGHLDGEFWLGLENVHQLTYGTPHELHVVLEDFDGKSTVAKYTEFAIGSEFELFKISKLGKYSGTAGDSFTSHNGSPFSTIDKDNDKLLDESCAKMFSGAWWHRDCHLSNLNGLYLKGDTASYADGIVWASFRGYYYSLKVSKMMIRSLV